MAQRQLHLGVFTYPGGHHIAGWRHDSVDATAILGYDYYRRTAVTAENGLREAEEGHPDAIILDLRMPLVDGLGFLRRLRAHQDQRATPVAIVTGDYFLDDTISNELRELGAELRFKPLWLEDLVGLARNLLKVTH